MTIPMQWALRRRMMMGANGQREIQWWLTEIDYIDPALSKHQPFYALAGMTWAEWCNSIYNPTPIEGGWAAIYVGDFCDGTPDVVCIGNENNAIIYHSGTYVLGSDVIIADYDYRGYMD